MKRHLIVVAATLLASSAFAADLPDNSGPVEQPYVSEGFNWTGFYVGGNVNYTWGDFNTRGNGARLNDAGGFGGGIQAGYNIQYDPLVLGIEGELGYSGADDSFDGAHAKLGWRGSLTPRVGYALGNWMPFVKGGLAAGHVRISDFGKSDTNTQFGWTVGIGAEYAITQEISIKAEYNYTDLGKDTFRTGGRPTKAGFTGSDVRLGVNYRF